jgi:hypothetical protein
MGQEIECSARVGGRTVKGRAQLETDELVFRGDERLRIRLGDITSAVAKDGELELRHKGGTVALRIGRPAARWADRINHPPTRADKLGVKAGQRVSFVGAVDEELAREIAGAGADVGRGRTRKGSDVVLLGVERARDLGRLAALAGTIARGGGIWVIYPKGRPDPREADVLAAGRDAGLVDVKVARVSDTHTGLKFVIPKARR